MAQRRMFSNRIIGSGKFLKMPISSQALYFHLIMHADDDGIVEAFQVIRKTGANEDDLKVLASKEYVRVLNEDLVTFILDWKEHNLIRADRKINSIYQKLLVQIVPEAKPIEPRPRADTGKPTGRPLDGEWTAQVRLGKDRLGKNIPVADATWNFVEEIEKLKTGKRKDYRIIALYWKKKKWVFENKEQFTAALTRELKPSKSLKGYTGNQIAQAISYCITKYPADGWTLETVFKRIQDLVNTKHE